MYYVYLLRCGDGSLYTGITTDPARRLAEHQAGGPKGSKYAAAHGALRMEAAFPAEGRALASRLEYRVKALRREEKEALIRGCPPPRLELDTYLAEAASAMSADDGRGPATAAPPSSGNE